MATLSFGVSGPNQNWTVALNIADTDSPRILAWLCSAESGFGTVSANVQSGETQQWVTRPATPEEAAQNYARATLNALLSSTVAWERAAAAQQAAEQVPTISVAA